MKARIVIEIIPDKVITSDWMEIINSESFNGLYELLEKGNKLEELTTRVNGNKVYIYSELIKRSVITVEVKQ